MKFGYGNLFYGRVTTERLACLSFLILMDQRGLTLFIEDLCSTKFFFLVSLLQNFKRLY